MKKFIEKLIGRLEECVEWDGYTLDIRDKMLKIVNELAEEYKGKYVKIGTLEQIMWERDVAISQLEALGYGFGQKVGWIPVSERLPEETVRLIGSFNTPCSDWVLITVKNNDKTFVGMGCLSSGKWFWTEGIIETEVIAWMPLPEEYKEGED